MAIPKSILQAKGLWKGKSSLNLPWLPAGKQITESDSPLHIDIGERDSFATISYQWQYEGKRQEGTMIVCQAKKSKAVQIAWVDSWHQHDSVLLLTGEESEDGGVKTKGTYTGGKEVWDWTVEFHLTDDTLTLQMDNVPPNAPPEWAVKATDKRP